MSERSPIELAFEVTQFLYLEAELLDDRRFDEWLGLLHAEMHYVMPVRATRPEGQPEFSDEMSHFDDTRETLGMRVERLKSGDAWAEVPPSRTRHYVTNIRVLAAEDGALKVRSNVLMMRARGDELGYQSLSAERRDVLVRADDGLRLRERMILLDSTTLPTYNLAFFL